MDRQFRTNLPVKTEILNTKFSIEKTRASLLENQQKQKHYHNKSSKKVSELKVGDSIILHE